MNDKKVVIFSVFFDEIVRLCKSNSQREEEEKKSFLTIGAKELNRLVRPVHPAARKKNGGKFKN
jgi:hypothetical protein